MDPILFAQRLAGRGAVDVSDDDLLGIGKLLSELVPVGLHRLAVASPGCEEFDEASLARFEDDRVLCGERRRDVRK